MGSGAGTCEPRLGALPTWESLDPSLSRPLSSRAWESSLFGVLLLVVLFTEVFMLSGTLMILQKNPRVSLVILWL